MVNPQEDEVTLVAMSKNLDPNRTQNPPDVDGLLSINPESTEAKLWDLLDDIDTIPDMLKPGSPQQHEDCWKAMVDISEKRHKLLKTDGHKLFRPVDSTEPVLLVE